MLHSSNNLENKIPLDTYWRFQLVCTKFHVHSSLEPPLEYHQDQIPLENQGSYINILQFQIGSRRESRWRDTWVIKIRVHRKVFSKQFCFIRPLNRRGIADLTLLRILLAMRQSPESEVSEKWLLWFISISDHRNYVEKSMWKRRGFFDQRNYIEKVRGNDVEIRQNLVFDVST